MKRLLILYLLLCTVAIFAEVEFSDLDLSVNDRLFFKATTEAPGHGSFNTLFLADLNSDEIYQQTFFPEKVTLIGSDGQVQIQNRFGVFRTDETLGNMKPVTRFPSFVNGSEIQIGKINAVGASPDGRFLLYFAPESFGYAKLVLLDTLTENESIISEQVEYTLSGPPVIWSPDSKFFVYSKQGMIYYFSIVQLTDNRVVNEKFRSLGVGSTANVRWGKNNDLYFVLRSLVYRIQSAEFFTRSLYSKLLNIGTVVGKIPFEFDPNFDVFWISPDGKKMLFGKGGRNVFLLFLQADDYLSTGDVQSLPYLFLPRNTRVVRVLWSLEDSISLLTASIEQGNINTTIFRLDLSLPSSSYGFTRSDEPDVLDLVLSPAESKVAVVKKDAIIIRDYRTWKDELTHSQELPLHVLWRSENELIISGTYFTELLDLVTAETTLVCLSQPEAYGFSDAEEIPLLQVGEKAFSFDVGTGQQAFEAFDVRATSASSASFRVYLEKSTTGSYKNAIMVRKVSGFGTEALFDFPEIQFEAFPAEQADIDFTNFTHGSRIRRREIALVFNAIDSVEGLTEILNTLVEYELTCTFFINGEFIRRHPGAVIEIAESGHEVGSLFYSYFNMTDTSFQINKEFIKQGLARNEDEYYSITGRELSLLWHAPYYFTSTDINQASREMNYTYVGRDVDPLDWVPFGDPATRAFYMPAADLVERALKLKKPGSIIPVKVGDTIPGRSDYLFNSLDTLINGLISLGYSIVPVSVLIDHAR